MRVLVGALASLLSVSFVGSLGSMSDPELVDPEGDLEYQNYYAGPRDHAQADIVAAWMDYEEASDAIVIHVQVPSTQRLENPEPIYSFLTRFDANLLVGGEFNGRILAEYHQGAGDPNPRANVSYYKNSESGSATSEPVPLPSTFELVVGEPGFYIWRIEREALQFHGEEATDFEALGAFYHDPGLPPGLFVGNILGGRDLASGQRPFVFTDAAPAVEAVPEETAPTLDAPSPSWAQQVGPTSALGFGLVAATLSLAAWSRRKT